MLCFICNICFICLSGTEQLVCRKAVPRIAKRVDHYNHQFTIYLQRNLLYQKPNISPNNTALVFQYKFILLQASANFSDLPFRIEFLLLKLANSVLYNEIVCLRVLITV